MSSTLSLAVAAKGECDPNLFIEALLEDGIIAHEDTEVHIAFDHDGLFDPVELPARIYLHQCDPATSILQLWGKALVNTTGNYVAVLDIKCPPKKGWLDKVHNEISSGSSLFFGPVDSGWNRYDRRIVGYLAEYAQFSSPLDVSLKEVPGNNIVCRRDLLDDDVMLEKKGFFKTFMLWRLFSEQRLEAQPVDGMIVAYHKPLGLAHYIGRRYVHGRCFGATRHDNAGQPSRWLCAGFTPVLPLLRSWRIYRAVRNHAELKAAFYRFFLLILCSECAWSAGELMGYVLGGRQYCDRLD